MSFKNFTVPLSLFNDDGMVCTTMKSELTTKLEKPVQSQTIMENLKNGTDCILFNCVSVVQMLLPPFNRHIMTWHLCSGNMLLTEVLAFLVFMLYLTISPQQANQRLKP